MKITSEEEYNNLRSLVFSNEDLLIRIRAQIIVLYEKGMIPSKISLIVEEKLGHIYLLLQYVDFFGLNDYLTISFEALKKKVDDELFRREKKKIDFEKRNILKYLFWPITSIFRTLWNFKYIAITIITWLFVSLKRLFSKPLRQENDVNTAVFEKGASNNYLLQINKVVINNKGFEETEDVEKYIANSKSDLQKQIEEIIKSNERITFNDPTVDYLINKGQEENKQAQSDKSRIGLYASLVVIYLIYFSSIKGGVWTLSVLGTTIILTITGNLSNNHINNSINDSFSTEKKPSITIQDFNDTTTTQNIDSLRMQIKSNEEIFIYDYQTYFNLVEDFYENDRQCYSLSAVGKKQKQFIYEYDHVDSRFADFKTEKTKLYSEKF